MSRGVEPRQEWLSGLDPLDDDEGPAMRISSEQGRALVRAVVVTAVQPWLPPVGAAVHALSTRGDVPVGPALLGLSLAGAAALVSWWVDTRR